MYILSKDSIRVRSKNKSKRKRNKKVNSRKRVEESFYKDINLKVTTRHSEGQPYTIKQATPREPKKLKY